MSAIHYEEIEKALLYVSEARERVEGASRVLAKTDGESHLVEALEEADRELLALHRRLMERTYFPVRVERQLALGDSAA